MIFFNILKYLFLINFYNRDNFYNRVNRRDATHYGTEYKRHTYGN